ncbi:hypothetical protein OQA88_4661 [Cercophora sp. LCS_1]
MVGYNYTIIEASSLLVSTGTNRGWYQQFTSCRDSSWAPQFFVLKSEAMGSHNTRDAYLSKDEEGRFWATTDILTGNHPFEWAGGGNPYWGLVHAETGGYLTAVGDGLVHLGPNNLGWDQALWRES